LVLAHFSGNSAKSLIVQAVKYVMPSILATVVSQSTVHE